MKYLYSWLHVRITKIVCQRTYVRLEDMEWRRDYKQNVLIENFYPIVIFLLTNAQHSEIVQKSNSVQTLRTKSCSNWATSDQLPFRPDL